MAQIEDLVEDLERSGDPETREKARALVSAILDLHARCIERILAVASDVNAGLVARFTADAEVASVLLLHGLHPEPVSIRAQRAVAGLAPRLSALGAEVELACNDQGKVTVHVRTAAEGGSSARTHAAQLIEQAIATHAPDADVHMFGASIDPTIVPASRLREGAAR